MQARCVVQRQNLKRGVAAPTAPAAGFALFRMHVAANTSTQQLLGASYFQGSGEKVSATLDVAMAEG